MNTMLRRSTRGRIALTLATGLWPALAAPPARAVESRSCPVFRAEAVTAAGREVLAAFAEQREVAYFNLAQRDDDGQTLAEVSRRLGCGDTVILDATQNHDISAVDRITGKLSGLMFAKPLAAVTRLSNGGMDVRPAGRDDAPRLKLSLQSGLPSLKKRLRAKRDLTVGVGNDAVVGKTVYLTWPPRSNLSCPLAAAIDADGHIFGSRDPCEASASFHATVRLDYFSSDSRGARAWQSSASPAAAGKWKFLRISQGLDGVGGAGWHVADGLSSEVGDYLPGLRLADKSGRPYWFGPFVGTYSVSLVPAEGNQDVAISDHAPLNTPVNVDIDASSSSIRQRGFTQSTTLSWPPGASLGVGVQQNDTETIGATLKYKLSEYATVNRTGGQRFKLAWEYAFDKPMRNVESEVLADRVHPIKKEIFSGTAYANFVPRYRVTYMAPFDKRETTTFSLSSRAKVQALLTFIRTKGPLMNNETATDLLVTDNFVVDWQSSFFLPDEPVRLKAYRHTGQYCLTVEDDKTVAARPCLHDDRQIWVPNRLDQLVSVKYREHCLAVSDGRLQASPCLQSGFQQWSWVGKGRDQLRNQATEQQVAVEQSSGTERGLVLQSEAQCASGSSRCAWRAYEATP